MARLLIARCAQCGKEETISDNVSEDRAAHLAALMPEDWRRVSVDFGNIGGKANAEVCSFICSVIWVNHQILVTMHNAEQQGVYFEDYLPKLLHMPH